MGKIYIDITEVLSIKFTSGIQRVVKEYTKRLVKTKKNIVLISNIQETDDYWIVREDQFDAYCNGEAVYQDIRSEVLSLTSLDQSDMFLDMDSVWNKFDQRRQLVYAGLKKHQVTIATLVYDILPMTNPECFHKDTLVHFILYLSAVLAYSDMIIVNSNATRDGLNKLCEERNLPRKQITVVPLGADFKNDGHHDSDELSDQVKEAVKAPFLMILGTIEPRKNHALLLEAYERGLRDLPINIVIAGRIGWNVDELMEKIQSHPDLGSRIFFLEKPSDSEVRYLYQNAFGLVFPSLGEGYGLPLVEAIHYGKLVFASDIPVFWEIGKDACMYFDPHRPDTLTEQVRAVLNYPKVADLYQSRIRKIHVITWEEASNMMKEAIEGAEPQSRETECPETGLIPEQLFMISARTEDILETLPFYEHFMPFIKEVVIGCPQRLVDMIRVAYDGTLKMTFVPDEKVIQGRRLPKDHQARNFMLRALAIQQPELQPVFIMADDDNRPLRTIPPEYFIRDGKFNLYYCNEDLRTWQGFIGGFTSYDEGIAKTADFMAENALPFRQYSSHEPQVICKRIFTEAIDRYPDALGKAIDEWSFYGNYAQSYYRDCFSSLPYTTMCWPAKTTDWNVTLPPKEYWFENFYRHLYAEGEIFSGCSTVWHEGILEENIRKIQARLAEQYRYAADVAVAKACDEIYHDRYGAWPIWEVNVDRMNIVVPHMLIARCGHVKKAPIIIRNQSCRKKLTITGYFEEEETGRRSNFKDEDLDLTKLNGQYELPIHFPHFKMKGFLHITFTLDEAMQAQTDIPVITY